MNRTISILSIFLLASTIFFCFGAISLANTVQNEMGGIHTYCADTTTSPATCLVLHPTVVFIVAIGSLLFFYFFYYRKFPPESFKRTEVAYSEKVPIRIEYISFIVDAFRRGILNPKLF